MKRPVFITGTGTGVGKTLVSAALATAWANEQVNYWKPVQAGLPADKTTLEELKLPALRIIASAYEYSHAASPDQAAIRGSEPQANLEVLVMQAKVLSQPTVIEGAGGLLVPLNNQGETWLDFLKATQLPTLLVATTGLGTLNHTSLTLRILELSGVTVVGVVLSGEEHAENLKTLQRLFPHVRFHWFPYLAEQHRHRLWQKESSKLANFVESNLDILAKENCDQKIKQDEKFLWHPYTQHQGMAEPLLLKRAHGVWLEDGNGNKLFDGTASWWVNTIGHGRPEIAAALSRQQQSLDHVIFAGASHKPALTLAETLVDKTQGKMQRVFFSDNGSTAVEVALKMAYQSFTNRGEKERNLFLSLEGGYHGDTFGAMAVGGSDGFHNMFRPLLFKSLRLSPVTTHRSSLCPQGSEKLADAITDLGELFKKHGRNLAGVILEPCIQGAAGMLVQDRRWLQAVVELAREYRVPVIFDEVFTGMGRCGDYFTFTRFPELKPDIVCLAKGLTGGTVPFAATLASEEIFSAFLADDKSKALFHGHSFTANPVGCAAALATLQIYEKDELMQNAQRIEATFKAWAAEAPQLGVENPRVFGAVLACELPGSGLGSYFHNRASEVALAAKRHGLFLRPLGNTIYLVPPLAATAGEISYALESLNKTLAELRV